MSNPAIIRQILEILVEVPTSQLLFINGYEERDIITNELSVTPSLTFAIRNQADVQYSCISTHQAIEYIFKMPEDDGIDVTVDEIIYPSVVIMSFNSHVASLICISPDEIYYIDYYEEMKRNTKDYRSRRLNYFLYRMTERELKNSIDIMNGPNWREYTRQFLGCNPGVEDDNDDLQFHSLFMYTKLHEYTNIGQFFDLLEHRLSLIRDEILNNTDLVDWSIHLNVIENIPVNAKLQDELEERLRGLNYTDSLLNGLNYHYREMLKDIELIEYQYL